MKSEKNKKELMEILKSLVPEFTINDHKKISGINSSYLP